MQFRSKNKKKKLTKHQSQRLRQHRCLRLPSSSLSADYHYPWSPMTVRRFPIQSMAVQTQWLSYSLMNSATQIVQIVNRSLGRFRKRTGSVCDCLKRDSHSWTKILCVLGIFRSLRWFSSENTPSPADGRLHTASFRRCIADVFWTEPDRLESHRSRWSELRPGQCTQSPRCDSPGNLWPNI